MQTDVLAARHNQGFPRCLPMSKTACEMQKKTNDSKCIFPPSRGKVVILSVIRHADTTHRRGKSLPLLSRTLSLHFWGDQSGGEWFPPKWGETRKDEVRPRHGSALPIWPGTAGDPAALLHRSVRH